MTLIWHINMVHNLFTSLKVCVSHMFYSHNHINPEDINWRLFGGAVKRLQEVLNHTGGPEGSECLEELQLWFT